MLDVPKYEANHTAATWVRPIQKSLVAIVTLTPLAVAIRYKWAEFILPLALVPLAVLVAISCELREAVAQSVSRWFRSAVGLFGLAAVLWLMASPFWSLDPAFAAVTATKVVGIIVCALVVAAALRMVSADLIFPLLVVFTITAACIAAFTALTEGAAHRAVGCCRNGMQADMTGAAVTIALFVWPCVGWLAAKGRRFLALLMLILVCLLITISKSGAAGLALLAGSVTVGIGILLPRLTSLLVILIASLALLVVPLLNDASRVLSEAGLLPYLQAYHATERIEIWSFYNELFWQRPWIGFGIDAERLLGNPARATEFTNLVPPRYAALHAHNAPLQILLEFGIVGATLVLATTTAVAVRLFVGHQTGVGFAMAPVVAFMAAAAVNFSLWEIWWLSVVSLVFVFSHRLLQAVNSNPAPRGRP